MSRLSRARAAIARRRVPGGVVAKLGLRDRIQAVVFSYESGLVERGLG